MDYQEFRNEILKVNSSRVHKVTNSVGVYDAYKWIRKNKWLNIERPLKEGEFYRIIRKINQYLLDELSAGHQVILPHRLGILELRKRPTRVEIVDNKLVTTLPVDWDATLKLWYEDLDSYYNKVLVRLENEEVFKIYYNKNSANYNNKSFYTFKPNRELQRKISKHAKEGTLDAFLFLKYD